MAQQRPSELQRESLLHQMFTGDKALWVIIAALAVISVLVVYSSTAKMAYDTHVAGSTGLFLRQQLVMLVLGFFAVVVVHKINCRVFYKWAGVAYALSIFFTLLAYFIGHETNGAARWIPVFGFRFQPSEMLKVATIVLLARQLASRQSRISSIRIVPSLNPFTWGFPAQRKIWREGTLPILLPIVVACAVILPAHTSSSLLVFISSIVMMFIGRVRLGELLRVIGLAAVAFMLVITLNLGRGETAEGRFSTWMHLWTTSQMDKPTDKLTDTERSMIAIYNGGLLGKGAGQSAMRVEMIHPESDYAYAFFVEEYGILLGLVMLLLYLWIFFRAREVFVQCGTAFPSFLVLGLAMMITCQALLHVMVTVNLMPETGQTLPLISRGGSSLLFNAVALGMILSVSRQNDEHSHEQPRSESILERKGT
jgi:cell division protein FtsW